MARNERVPVGDLTHIDVEMMMHEYSEMGLLKLDDCKWQLKSRFRQEESSREVRVAIWKSSPYSLIPLFSASIVAGFLSVPENNWWIILLPISVFMMVCGISYYCWKSAKRFDIDIAETEVRLEIVDHTIQEKEALLKNNLGVLLREISQSNVDNYDILEFGRENTKPSGEFKVANDLFSGPSLDDLNHRYGPLMDLIQRLKRERRTWLDLAVKMFYDVDSRLEDACQKSNVEQVIKTSIRSGTIIAICIMSNKPISEDDFIKKYNQTFISQYQIPITVFFSIDKQFSHFRDIIRDSDLNKEIEQFEETRRILIQSQRDLEIRLSYIIGK